MKKIIIVIFAAVLFTGCVKRISEEPKRGDLTYTVVPKQNVPEELAIKIDEAKGKSFRITYADQGYLYIVRGYGEQPTSGYSIEVDELYDTEHTISIQTSLIGPKQSEKTQNVKCYPYIVVKLEYIEKEVLFH